NADWTTIYKRQEFIMALHELHHVAEGKLDPKEMNNTRGADQSSPPHNDLFELVWEKDQISVPGQSSRARKSPNCTSLPPHTPRGEVGYANNNATITKMGKYYGNLSGELNENKRLVPSGDVNLSEEEEDMVMPWLNYGMDESLQHGYSSDFFHELSGVTMNEPSPSNNFSLLDRRNNSNKVFRDTHKHSSFASFRSKVVDIAENNGTMMERQGPVMCSNSSTMMNFSHFAKPVAMVKANLQNIGLTSRSESVGIKNRGAAATVTNPVESTKCETFCKQVSKIGQTSNLVVGESGNKGQEAVDKSVEPAVVSSSVCSGNGAERASDDPNQDLKRKSRDIQEFECQSEDVEEESVGVKKEVPARRVGSKRSRSAEVHNLSERRRRVKINEKMRTLQELIPNCNKVDICFLGDKASMLDEAIEYIKTLQLQLQIMSMGSGLYMPAMMLPPHMHAPHVGSFSPIGVGMQMRLGMGMPDANDESCRFPMMQGTQMPRSNAQVFGLPSQGHPMPMPHAPIFSFSGEPFINPSTLGINACGTPLVDRASASSLKDPNPMPHVKSQVVQNTSGCNSTN
ncbi:Transcription factor PIF3, partial [Mucuna pruriens]